MRAWPIVHLAPARLILPCPPTTPAPFENPAGVSALGVQSPRPVRLLAARRAGNPLRNRRLADSTGQPRSRVTLAAKRGVVPRLDWGGNHALATLRRRGCGGLLDARGLGCGHLLLLVPCANRLDGQRRRDAVLQWCHCHAKPNRRPGNEQRLLGLCSGEPQPDWFLDRESLPVERHPRRSRPRARQ